MSVADIDKSLAQSSSATDLSPPVLLSVTLSALACM